MSRNVITAASTTSPLMMSRTAGGVELGLSICYDLRFPELYRILAVQGARVVTVPAWPVG